mgnify:FL=1|tara:strand:- start:4315 stop:4599 length:285 start_codon:yes stop_codon:yes gene_type:complete
MNNTNESFRNVRKQASKILKDISNSYNTGLLDDPNFAANFTALLACICEGKVTGRIDETGDVVLWSLTPEYEAQLLEQRRSIAESLNNTIKGPW